MVQRGLPGSDPERIAPKEVPEVQPHGAPATIRQPRSKMCRWSPLINKTALPVCLHQAQNGLGLIALGQRSQLIGKGTVAFVQRSQPFLLGFDI